MLTYGDSLNTSCVNFSIVDDSEPDSLESFLLLLTTTDKLAIMVDPQYAIVVIVDNDTEGNSDRFVHERRQ